MADALHTPGVTSAAEARFDDAGLLAVGSGGLTSARSGVLAGPGSTALVSGTSSTSPMRYSIAPHHWVTSRGVVSDGVYRGGAETTQLVDTTAAPGSGSRIDIVWVKQQDSTSTISPDGTTAPLYGCTQGASSTGTPSAPSIPVGAEEIARCTVPAGTTRTDTGVTIAQTAQQVVARGARVPVRTQAERDALTAYRGLEVYRLDTGQIQICTAVGPPATWARVFDPVAPATNIVYGSAFQENAVSPLRPTRGADGFTTLAGLISNSQVVNNVAGTWFTLPAGFRPTSLQVGLAYIETVGLAAYTIDTNGVVAGIGMVVGTAPVPTPRYWSINSRYATAGIPS